MKALKQVFILIIGEEGYETNIQSLDTSQEMDDLFTK